MIYRVAVGILVASLVPIGIAQTMDPHAVNANTIDLSRRDTNDLGLGTRLSGAIRGMDDAVIKDARVEVCDLSTGAVIVVAYTGPQGQFQVNRLPVGSYEVVATSGLSEARERVRVTEGDTMITLRMPNPATARASELGGRHSVSVAQMQVPEKALKEFKKAQSAWEKQKFEEAAKRLDRALDIYPQFADAYTLRGVMHLSRNNLDDACANLERAIEIDGESGLAYVVLGAAYTSLTRFEDAVRVLERAVSLLPNSWQAQFELGRAQLAKGNFEGALRHASNAQQLGANDYAPVHLIKAHALLGLKHYTDAMAELQVFLSKDPQGPQATKARETLSQVKAFAAR